MDKLSKAWRRSKTFSRQPRQPSVKPTPKKVVKMSSETVDALRQDATAPRGPAETSLLPKGSLDPRLISFMEPDSAAAECFKLLRAKIFTRNSESRPRSIMVTSPQPMDGKSMVAVNLAINIARGINEYVMLVDCDLRRPSMHRLLGLNAREGIREYLEKATSVASYLMKTPFKKLTLLPAGKPPPNPSELLSSEKMRLLVDELKARYEDRYIIFDAPAAQFSAETAFLASMTDAVLLVVRSGKTAKDLVLETIENVGRERILGVVFNASTESRRDYGYYYRHYGSHKSSPGQRLI